MHIQLLTAYYHPPAYTPPFPLPILSGCSDLPVYSFLMCHTPGSAPDSVPDKPLLPHHLIPVLLFSGYNLSGHCHLHCLHIRLHCLCGYRDVTLSFLFPLFQFVLWMYPFLPCFPLLLSVQYLLLKSDGSQLLSMP